MPQVELEDRWVEHDQGRIFTRSWIPSEIDPTRAPIVMLHDSLGSVELWRRFPQELAAAANRQVVAYDRLGFGRSDARLEQIPFDFVPAEARDYFGVVVEQLGIDQFVLFGHSVGGGMATFVAAAYQDRCQAIIAESAQNFVEDRTRDGIFAALAGFADPGQFARLTKYHGAKAQWVLDSWVNSWTSDEFRDWSLGSILGEVHCPMLVIHGELDEYGSVAHPKQISAGIAGPATCVILPGIHHIPHREVPDQIMELVVDFLGDI